jgi:hypothetical protein
MKIKSIFDQLKIFPFFLIPLKRQQINNPKIRILHRGRTQGNTRTSKKQPNRIKGSR